MPTHDFISENDTSLASGGTATHSIQQVGAASLSGSVTRSSSSYDLNIIWKAEDGTSIETESIASGVAGGTQTTFDVPVRSPYATVQIVDAATNAAGSYDLVAHMR